MPICPVDVLFAPVPNALLFVSRETNSDGPVGYLIDLAHVVFVKEETIRDGLTVVLAGDGRVIGLVEQFA